MIPFVRDGLLWLLAGVALLALAVWGDFASVRLNAAEKQELPPGRRQLARLADSGHRVLRAVIGIIGALGLAEGILLLAGSQSASASAATTNRILTAVVDGGAGFLLSLALASALAGPFAALLRRKRQA